jgi:flavin reductase (NADH)/flavin reductase/chlorophenol-4-monooxygenase component 1
MPRRVPLDQPSLAIDSDVPPDISAADFREALSRAVTPVTVVTTAGHAGMAGITCSAVSSVCDSPPTILVCINRKSYANGIIKGNGVLCVNWLSAGQKEIANLFAGVGAVPMEERFSRGEWQTLATGAPAAAAACVALDCEILSASEIGTHSVFLARVLARTDEAAIEPLVYCRRSYATAQPHA